MEPDGTRTPPTPSARSPPPTSPPPSRIIIYLIWRFDDISCTPWLGAEACMADTMPLITARSSRGMLVRWVPIRSSQCCLINLQGFCLSFTLVDLKVWIYLYYPTTGAILMCTELLRTTRWNNLNAQNECILHMILVITSIMSIKAIIRIMHLIAIKNINIAVYAYIYTIHGQQSIMCLV